jgi:hypothetical protein
VSQNNQEAGGEMKDYINILQMISLNLDEQVDAGNITGEDASQICKEAIKQLLEASNAK